MNKLFLIICFLSVSVSHGQVLEGTAVSGEIGLSVGAAHYFGDLNPNGNINRPKMAFGAFFRKQFGKYIGLKVSGHFAQLGYSDIYSKNEVQKRRNLSFNTNTWELALSGDFHLYQFFPGQMGYEFTPYVTLGMGLFTYDPYAYLKGQKYFLKPLHTEGQTYIAGFQPYNSMAMCFPVGLGFKYNVRGNTNVFMEFGYRFTNTDYLDDVSTAYAGSAAFPPLANGDPSPAFLLQDRSYELGTPIGIKDRQRGISKQNDQYAFVELGVSISLFSYKCPTAKY